MEPSVCLCVLSWYIILSHSDTEFTLGFMYTAVKSNPPARRAMRTDNGVGEMAMIMPYANFNGAGMAYRAMACTRETFHPQQCPDCWRGTWNLRHNARDADLAIFRLRFTQNRSFTVHFAVSSVAPILRTKWHVLASCLVIAAPRVDIVATRVITTRGPVVTVAHVSQEWQVNY